MSVVRLVRHGQASFGAADYDQLSPLGEDQSRILGVALTAPGRTPTTAVRGEMKRHAQTAEHAGFADAGVDPGWNEFNHVQVLAAHASPDSSEAQSDKQAFQRWFEEATHRWMTGRHDDDYDESFDAFTSRVQGAMRRTTAGLGSGDSVVVFTSGGPIAAVATALLGGGPDLWVRLNSVTINTGVTEIVIGSRGTTLVSFNEHAHLDPAHLTYR